MPKYQLDAKLFASFIVTASDLATAKAKLRETFAGHDVNFGMLDDEPLIASVDVDGDFDLLEEFPDDPEASVTEFETAVHVCADSVEKLRPSDFYRAIGLAFDQGPDERTPEERRKHTEAFVKWLKEKRPDQSDRIDTEFREVMDFEDAQFG